MMAEQRRPDPSAVKRPRPRSDIVKIVGNRIELNRPIAITAMAETAPACWIPMTRSATTTMAWMRTMSTSRTERSK